MQQMVIKTRKHLEKKLYSQIGALAISYDLNREEIISPPILTINKILRRNSLIHQKTKYIPKGVNYSYLLISQSNYLHQLDIIGPRHIKEDG